MTGDNDDDDGFAVGKVTDERDCSIFNHSQHRVAYVKAQVPGLGIWTHRGLVVGVDYSFFRKKIDFPSSLSVCFPWFSARKAGEGIELWNISLCRRAAPFKCLMVMVVACIHSLNSFFLPRFSSSSFQYFSACIQLWPRIFMLRFHCSDLKRGDFTDIIM